MRIIARGSAPTRRAWPISASPRKINSFWRRRERSCAKWLPDPDKACWRGTSDVAISFAKQLIQAIHLKAIDQMQLTKGRSHAAHDRRKARHVPQDARSRLLRAAKPLRH